MKPPRPGRKPSKEEIEKIEAKIPEVAEEKGFTTKRDEQGRLVMVDKNGTPVPLEAIMGENEDGEGTDDAATASDTTEADAAATDEEADSPDDAIDQTE